MCHVISIYSIQRTFQKNLMRTPCKLFSIYIENFFILFYVDLYG